MSMQTKIRVLFVAYGGGHIKVLVPVIKRLLGDDRFDVKVIGLTTASSVLKAENIPYIGFKDFIDSSYAEEISYGEELLKNLDCPMLDEDESVAYLGLSFSDLVNDMGYKAAKKLYDENGRSVFFPVRTMTRILKTLSPDIVITTNSPRAEQASIVAAGKLGIKSICMGDLLLTFEKDWIADNGFADVVCVLGESVKYMLVSNGRSPEDIVVTGNPAFDKIVSKEVLQESVKFRLSMGWDNKNIVMWAMPPGNNTFYGCPLIPKDEIIKALYDIYKKYEEIEIICRPHPNFKESVKLPKEFYVSESSEDVHKIINSSDVVIVETSTVGLEAALVGKSVITMRPDHDFNPYAKLGLAKDIYELDELEEAILKPTPPDVTKLGSPAVGTFTDNVLRVVNNLML